MSDAIVASAISGVIAIVVAVLAGWLSYTQALKQVREGGRESRATAEREYQLQAMKNFREVTGGPKSQIIESVHDLSDRLRGFLSREQAWDWTETDGYYRRSFVWLIIRPFVWIEILRRRMVYLDQTLGELVEDELRFLRYCRLLEDALTSPGLFLNTDYDRAHSEAHIFSGNLRATAERFAITEDSGRLVCMRFHKFDEAMCEPGVHGYVADVERLVSNLHVEDHLSAFRRARLVAMYCATSAFLQHYHLPFREVESLEESMKYCEVIPDDLCQPIQDNLRRMLGGLSPAVTSS